MYKPQCRRTPHRTYNSVSKPVKAGMCRRQSLIDRIGRLEIFVIVYTTVPFDIPFFRLLSVHFSYTTALTTSQLLQSKARNILIGETHHIHLSDNIKMLALVCDHFRLFYNKPRTVRQRSAAGIISDALLTNPAYAYSAVANKLHSPV